MSRTPKITIVDFLPLALGLENRSKYAPGLDAAAANPGRWARLDFLASESRDDVRRHADKLRRVAGRLSKRTGERFRIATRQDDDGQHYVYVQAVVA